MINIHDLTKEIEEQGYTKVNAQAKLCQNIVLKMIAESSYKRNVTIKGGVVMRSLSGSERRATQDIDIDFIRYSLSEEAIVNFIDKINTREDIKISIVAPIEELKQQDYNGKRVYISIRDKYGNDLSSKIDFGVYKNMDIEQED